MILQSDKLLLYSHGKGIYKMEFFKKYNKFLLLVITIVALCGVLFPLISISVNFFGTTTVDFSLIDVLDSLRGDAPHEIVDLIASHILESDIGRDIVLPFAAYVLALVLIVISIPFNLTNKFKLIKITFVSLAIASIIYAGIGINAMSELIVHFLEDGLADLVGEIAGLLVGDLAGFLVGGLAELLTSLVDFSNILDISLGVGYWITLSTLLLLLVLLIVAKIVDLYTKEDKQHVQGSEELLLNEKLKSQKEMIIM